ncbi:MAG: DNA-processing protein DprA [Lachnospiraceae bacterium]|nr:DNA-processing protein DprA [Lachnospiraceae bacterium]
MNIYIEKALRSEESNLLWLCSINALELSEKFSLLEKYESVDEIFDFSRHDKINEAFTLRVREILKTSADSFSEEKVRNELWKKEAEFISCKSEKYPTRFYEIDRPPIGFFAIGKLPDDYKPSVAVVGARACSEYGVNICKSFAGELAAAGVQIISGMALGIDGVSHKACLDAGGKTFAVMGNGIGTIYPRENSLIYNGILKTGGVISEYYIGSQGIKTHFPERNRLIAGLSDGLLVVEARKKSGTMITVNRTLEQGKDVFVIPGRIGDPLSEGCLELIKKGAQLVTDVNDIAFALKEKYPDYVVYRKDADSQYSFAPAGTYNNSTSKNQIKLNLIDLTENEKKIIELLGAAPVYFDELVMKSDLDYFTAFEIIEGMKGKGIIKDADSGRICKALNI